MRRTLFALTMCMLLPVAAVAGNRMVIQIDGSVWLYPDGSNKPIVVPFDPTDAAVDVMYPPGPSDKPDPDPPLTDVEEKAKAISKLHLNLTQARGVSMVWTAVIDQVKNGNISEASLQRASDEAIRILGGLYPPAKRWYEEIKALSPSGFTVALMESVNNGLKSAFDIDTVFVDTVVAKAIECQEDGIGAADAGAELAKEIAPAGASDEQIEQLGFDLTLIIQIIMQVLEWLRQLGILSMVDIDAATLAIHDIIQSN